ncbi:hypothetical protein EPI10_030547 [Gossypium australe]|uniref:Uncharacterized protein n=1 Tax=Gossypium australe TaxID=47621 RepID=A0A5B6WXI1_9ROSI|nr:hypothetical protein EPI10_030547 [Gossypium australe]
MTATPPAAFIFSIISFASSFVIPCLSITAASNFSNFTSNVVFSFFSSAFGAPAPAPAPAPPKSIPSSAMTCIFGCLSLSVRVGPICLRSSGGTAAIRSASSTTLSDGGGLGPYGS